MGMLVYTPCPIAEWLEMTVTVSSGEIRRKAFGAKTSPVAGAASAGFEIADFERNSGTKPAMHRPPVAPAVVLKNVRRPKREAASDAACCNKESNLSFSWVLFISDLSPRPFRRHGGWRGGCAGTCRSGRYFRPWLRQCRCRWA